MKLNKKKAVNKLLKNRIAERDIVILNAFSLGAITMAKMALSQTEDKINKADNYEELRLYTDELVNYLKQKIKQELNTSDFKSSNVAKNIESIGSCKYLIGSICSNFNCEKHGEDIEGAYCYLVCEKFDGSINE